MRALVRSVAVAVVVAVSISGCWPSKGAEPEPTLGVIPPTATAGAALVCGMDKASLEAVTGFTIGRTEGALEVVDGIGSGECSAWPTDESLVTGALVDVRMYAASSPDGVKGRSKLLGQDGLRAPDVEWPSVDGGIWGDVTLHPERYSSGAVSLAFVGETVVEILLSRGAVDRNIATGQLALTQQVAATYALPGRANGS